MLDTILFYIIERSAQLSNPDNKDEIYKLLMALVSLISYNQSQAFLDKYFFILQIAIRRFKNFIFT